MSLICFWWCFAVCLILLSITFLLWGNALKSIPKKSPMNKSFRSTPRKTQILLIYFKFYRCFILNDQWLQSVNWSALGCTPTAPRWRRRKTCKTFPSNQCNIEPIGVQSAPTWSADDLKDFFSDEENSNQFIRSKTYHQFFGRHSSNWFCSSFNVLTQFNYFVAGLCVSLCFMLARKCWVIAFSTSIVVHAAMRKRNDLYRIKQLKGQLKTKRHLMRCFCAGKSINVLIRFSDCREQSCRQSINQFIDSKAVGAAWRNA